jgi:general secretion pathway protein G
MNSKQNPVDARSAMDVFKIAGIVSGIGLAGLTAALFWYLFSGGEETPAELTKSNMVTIAQGLAHYRSGCHLLPTTEQGLGALLAAPDRGPKCAEIPSVILEKLPVDGWGHPYLYESDGKEFKLTSYGRDGKQGGEGADADILYRGSP